MLYLQRENIDTFRDVIVRWRKHVLCSLLHLSAQTHLLNVFWIGYKRDIQTSSGQLTPSAICPHIGAGSGKKRSDSEKLQCFMKRMQIIHYIFLLTYHVLIARRLLGAEGCDFVKTEWTSRIVRLEFESLGWNCLAMLPRKSNWNSPGYHFLICIRKMMPMFQVY